MSSDKYGLQGRETPASRCARDDIGLEECRCERCIDDIAGGVAAMGPEDFESSDK